MQVCIRNTTPFFFVGGCCFFSWLGQVGIPTHTCIRNVHKQVFDKCTILFSALDNTFLLLGVGKEPSMCMWNLHRSQISARGATRNLFVSFSLCSPWPFCPSGMRFSPSGPHSCPPPVLLSPPYSGFYLSCLPAWTVLIYNTALGSSFWNPSVCFLQHWQTDAYEK